METLGLAEALGELEHRAVLHDAGAHDLVVEVGLDVLERERVVDDLDVAGVRVARGHRPLRGGCRDGLLAVAAAGREERAGGASRPDGEEPLA
jgi:hypothetical protein